MNYSEITKEKIDEALKEAFSKTPQRSVKIITWRAGYELFCKALEEEFKKKYREVEQSGSSLGS